MQPEVSYSVPEAEKILGIEKSAIYKKIREGELQHNKCRPIRIRKSYLQSFVLQKAPHAWHIWNDQPVATY